MVKEIKGIAFSHTGNFRSNNEDSIYWGPVSGDAFENETITSGFIDQGAFLAAVADGVGGCIAGEEASLLAVNVVQEQLSKYSQTPEWNPELHLRTVLEEAHAKIVSSFKADPAKDGMATTFTGLFFRQNQAYLMHIGDSRCYRFTAGQLSQISTDHSPVGEMVADGRLTEDEAHIHPYRSYIDRVLGNTDKPIEPLISPIPLKRGDRWLICSDGLSDSLYKEQIEILFQTHRNNSIEDLAVGLMDAALDNGGRDNVSLSILELGSPSLWTRTRQLLRGGISARAARRSDKKAKPYPAHAKQS